MATQLALRCYKPARGFFDMPISPVDVSERPIEPRLREGDVLAYLTNVDARIVGWAFLPTTARGGGTPCMGPWMSRVKTWREPLFFFLSARTEVGRASHRSGRRRSTSRVRRRPDRWLAS